MKVAVIGAGISGLSTAWLLDSNHEVVLYEKNDFLGGHARTVTFEFNGKHAYANPAFGYIAPHLYPQFMKLVTYLDVKLIPSPTSAVVYSRRRGKAVFITPTFEPRRLQSMLSRSKISALLDIRRFMTGANVLYEGDDWTTTLEAYCDSTDVSDFVKTQIIYPWMAAISEATIEEIKGFSARAALKYPVGLQPANVFNPYGLVELDGGVAAYIEPLIRTLKSTVINCLAGIESITKENGQFIVTDSTGSSLSFDHVVIAAPAFEAERMLGSLAGSERLRSILARFTYNNARVIVHSDPSVMPPNRAEWSAYNAMYDGRECEATIWCRDCGEFDYFKSWMTFEAKLPKDIHGIFDFRHPKPTPDFYRAQQALTPLQGQDNLWFAGTYVQDIDSHESGITSAINIARRLNPKSANLARLK
jgi:predicted NAD/FAD-binding protein